MKRRDFTTAGCLLLGCAGIPTLAAAAMQSPAQCTAAPMSQGYFSSMLSSAFQARLPEHGAVVELVLQQVESAGCEQQYFLQFQHHVASLMPEGIYQLSTADGTAMSLFLQPSLQQPQRLTAVINQLG